MVNHSVNLNDEVLNYEEMSKYQLRNCTIRYFFDINKFGFRHFLGKSFPFTKTTSAIFVVSCLLIVVSQFGCVTPPHKSDKVKLLQSLATKEVKAELSLKQRLLTEGGELVVAIMPRNALAGGLQDIETNAVVNLDPAKQIGKIAAASSSAIPNPGGDGEEQFRYVRSWKMVSEGKNGILIDLSFENIINGDVISSGTAQVLIRRYKDGKYIGEGK